MAIRPEDAQPDAGHGTERRRREIALAAVVALCGLVAIVAVENLPVRHSVAHKLTTESTGALRRAGVPYEKVTVSGRDATITVSSTADGDRAIAIVRSVDGVRTVHLIIDTGGPASAPSPSVSITAAPSAPASTPPSAGGSSLGTPPPGTPSPAAPPSAPPTTAPPGSVQQQLDAAGSIRFAWNSAALTAPDMPIVTRVAAILAANPSVHIQLVGNTDSTGPAAFNLTMSRARAQAVADALHRLGVATERMSIVGHGESDPKAPNNDPHGRAVNRRVDLLAKGL
jgi:outer membrane protein OmpA-like peptidoglycan-associated protein